MVMDAQQLHKLERQSVQDLPDAPKEGVVSDFWGFTTQRGPILPPWGTRESERWLRWYYRHEYNWMGQSAFGGLVKKVASTAWEIKGKRRVTYFQDVLRGAHFGRGWSTFIKMGVLDFLRQDGGWYIELIAPGNPSKAPTGPVTGIAYLDSLRCFPTGDPEYPVIYYSRKGKMHLLHFTRVRQTVDLPDGDESNPGYGTCALRRAISIVVQQVHMNRYIEAKLDDKPQPGYMVASGITKGQREEAFAKFKGEQQLDALPEWGKTVWFYSPDKSMPIDLKPVSFSEAPQNWSYKEYTELHANAWALALGVDVQELWQLTGGSLGSGQQSQILHAKSQGKTFGDLLASIERTINDVLPDSLEFQFKHRDAFESQSEATTAQAWAGVATAAGTSMTAEEKRQMLANKVEAIKDAITDENGEIIRLDDSDPEPEGEQTVDDAAAQNTQETAAAAAPDQTADDQKAAKSIQSTRLAFEGDFEDLIEGARSGDVTRRRFGIILRDLLRKYGKKAYADGLTEGGVEDGELDDDDLTGYTALLAEQSQYVTGLTASVYAGGGLSEAEADGKPTLWFNKSISAFYDAGRLSADKNGLYEFTGDDGEESCLTCKKLKGQRHRFRWWAKHKLRPRVDTENYECKGFQCKHRLVKTTLSAAGRINASKLPSYVAA